MPNTTNIYRVSHLQPATVNGRAMALATLQLHVGAAWVHQGTFSVPTGLGKKHAMQFILSTYTL